MSSPISEIAPAGAVNPAYMETEETFEGWGVGDNAEAALDAPDPEEAIEESAESEEEDESEEETGEETGDEEDEKASEESEDEEEETEEETGEETGDEEDPEQYEDLGKKGKARLRQLLEERKAEKTRLEALEARLAAAEAKNANDRIASHLEEQLAMQRQAFEYATQQRLEQERAARENIHFETLLARGYKPGMFEHDLAVENMRKIDEFIAQMQPQVQTIDQRHAEIERQSQVREYTAQLTANFNKGLEGLEVKPEVRTWLFENTKRLAIQHDATAEEAVMLAFKEANQLGILPKRQAKPALAKPKTKPPKHVVEAVAKKGNRSGRKPGKQTKNKGRRTPEDDAFPETADGEW